MELLKFIVSALFGIVASSIIWLLFYWLTPWEMSFGWGGVVIDLLCGSVFIGIFVSICTLILSFVLFMINRMDTLLNK